MASKSGTKRSKAKNSGRERFKSFMSSPAGIWIAAILSVALLLTINALIAGNSLDLFLGLTAFVIIAATVVVWVILLHRRTK
ncbi:MAG: hypothetical protein GX034_03000 [Clostridiaceae bacterium]|jgi:hypothetical protein|nr:hypothetical protein [Clostridiaceae bacterium]